MPNSRNLFRKAEAGPGLLSPGESRAEPRRKDGRCRVANSAGASRSDSLLSQVDVANGWEGETGPTDLRLTPNFSGPVG